MRVASSNLVIRSKKFREGGSAEPFLRFWGQLAKWGFNMAETRFRETRVMKGREASTVLEVTEYESPRRIRLVSDEGGTIWDTVFTVAVKEYCESRADL